MASYWITFHNRSPGCMPDCDSPADADMKASRLDSVKSIRPLPYAAEPLLAKTDTWPLCGTPQDCVGLNSCPRDYSCSE